MKSCFVLASMLALMLAACGTPGSLPDAPPCPDTDPFLAPGRDLDATTYAEATHRALADLQLVDQVFRREWPERRFRDRDSFKRDFVAFAGGTRCLISDVRGASVPEAARPISAELLAFLSEVEISLEKAEEAVDTRNASAYDDWTSDFDRLVIGYTDFQGRLVDFRVDQ